MKNLDRTDLKILQALQSEGRLTNQTLAARVALSPSAIGFKESTDSETDGNAQGPDGCVPFNRCRPANVVGGGSSTRWKRIS